MGTSLTGLTPATTYDALIKVGDNGPLSATAKVLSDGLGNDSPLAMSTTLVGIGTASPQSSYKLTISGNDTIFPAIYLENTTNSKAYSIRASGTNFSIRDNTSGDDRITLTTAGNVGIGTGSPSEPLVVSSLLRDYTSAQFSTLLQSTTAQSVGRGGSLGLAGETGGGIIAFGGIIGAKENSVFAETGGYLAFTTRANNGPLTEKVRILSSGGITFNGDTAAANALDDYEEGTWTPSLGGNTTYLGQVGTYTKIGRQVTINFYLGVNVLGTGSGSDISGLPFTAFSTSRGGGGLAFSVSPSSNYASMNPLVNPGTATVIFVTSTILGVWADNSTVFADNTQISGTCTYFV